MKTFIGGVKPFIGGVKTFIGGVKPIVRVAVAAAVILGLGLGVALLLFGGKELRYKTQAELLAAMPRIASAELYAHGHHLALPLACRNMPHATKRNMLVGCVGTTAKKEPVKVFGAAEDEAKEEYYTILVDGRPLVQNAHCLGADCHVKKD